jgi:24-methylenesterol C-methyltransferase
MDHLNHATQQLEHAFQRCSDYANENRRVVVIGGVVAVAISGLLFRRRDSYQKKPSTSQLSGGSIDKRRIKNEMDAYSQSYGQEAGEGIKDRSKTTELVNTFYNLVTDIYEWGWGQSFHFSPLLPGKNAAASEAAHEARLAALLRLQPGMKCLDVGCGVGGPMRTIASTSGANVTGITINDYQVQRATYHNAKLRLQSLCQAVEGNFLEMPFAHETYDAAYAIEATCHANKLEQVYGEVFRVLKPGAFFASYEWVSTKEYDANNPQHVKIIDEINYGNGLPEMRTYTEAEQAGKNVGFNLVISEDIATASPVCGPWYNRLQRIPKGWNQAMVNGMSAIGLCPKGVKEVHDMLINVATSLEAGGETGIFSPMHLLLFQKPLQPTNGKK